MRYVAQISMVLYFQGMGGLLRSNFLLNFSVGLMVTKYVFSKYDGMMIIIIIDIIIEINKNFLIFHYCML